MMRVVELFAGVGGFRIGFEGPPENPDRSRFGVIWSNQWEPSTKTQHAAEVYVQQWNLEQSDYDLEVYSNGSDDIFVNKDIGTIEASDIPDHDLLCGGFPCQDYSVARTSAKGLEGKKGVLWWEIFRILKEKRPGIVMLENVDRLLKSPTSQRGRDFAVMLASLSELDYVVEWRVINAADYGMPQRRRRVFILAYGPGTPQHEALSSSDIDILNWMEKEGVHARAFPIQPLGVLTAVPHPIKGTENADLADVSEEFNIGAKPTATSPFKETGVMIGGHYYTYRCKPRYEGEYTTLSDILLTPRKVSIEYCIEPDSVLKEKGWKYLKGAKEEPRKGTGDFTYFYKEGPMIFPDALDKPSRTIITGEGGATASRFKHVVKFKPTKKMRDEYNLDSDGVQQIRKEIGLKKSEWIRRLTPVELERLNMFPDNHTADSTDAKRAFFMGNALVIGIVERMALYLGDS
jgi:DNA (cytosine-5)-methyltransferase 1